jgi:Icc-related predicted phosphoesterase
VKLLVVADLHYTLRQFDWLLRAAPDYDCVAIAGDLLDTSSIVDPGAQIVVVLKYIRRLSALTRVLVCSGNHDISEPGGDGEKRAAWLEEVRRYAVPADGDTITLGNALVTICPWWDGPQTQQAIVAQLDAAALQRTGPWIWIYHAPPPDSPISWGGQRYFGDAALPPLIARHKPDLVFCGHVHEAPFMRNGSWVDRVGGTWVFNGGRQVGPIPTAIAVDLEARRAAWFSLEGAEEVSLDAPLVRPLAQLTGMPAWMTQLPGMD